MSYINVALAAVPAENKDAYCESAAKMGALFKKLGAERVIETWECEVPDGRLTSIPLAVNRQEGEAIVLSVIFWPSKQIADNAMAEMMQSEEAKAHMPHGLFDFSRLIHGGFEMMLDITE